MSGLISGDNLGSNLDVNAMMGFTNTISTNAFVGHVEWVKADD